MKRLKNTEHLPELSKYFEVSPVVISRWKKEFLENMSKAFGGKSDNDEDSVDTERLYAQIGQLKVENDYLKKSLKKTGL